MKQDALYKTLDSPEAAEALSRIQIIYTDLDGTLLAPGGRVLVDHAGDPSTALAEALVTLAHAGIEVMPVTGRNRNQLIEICRLLDFNGFIAELGSVYALGQGSQVEVSYVVGDWEHNVHASELLAQGKTPYEVIEESGVPQKLLELSPGRLEYHLPWARGRETTHLFRGNIDITAAQRILDDSSLPLTLLDNGVIHPRSHTLAVGDDSIHGYHVLPKGVTKVAALSRDMQRRGVRSDQVIAIGDSLADIQMGEATDVFVLLRNALDDPRIHDALAARKAAGKLTLVTKNLTCDGWVEFATALLANLPRPL